MVNSEKQLKIHAMKRKKANDHAQKDVTVLNLIKC